MAGRKIYLCSSRLAKDDPRGDPFFNCGHHFDKLKGLLDKRKSGASVDKIAEADDEACEHCLGDWYTEQFKKSRKRAVVLMNSLLAECDEQSKNDSL